MKEELKGDQESVLETEHSKILMMKNSRALNWDDYIVLVSRLIESAKTYDLQIISKEISACTNEYKPELKKVYPKISNSILSEL